MINEFMKRRKNSSLYTEYHPITSWNNTKKLNVKNKIIFQRIIHVYVTWSLEKFRPCDNDPRKAKSASGFNLNFDGLGCVHKIMALWLHISSVYINIILKSSHIFCRFIMNFLVCVFIVMGESFVHIV